MRSHLRIVRFVHYILKTFVNLCVCLLFHLFHSDVLVRTNEEERKKYFASLVQGLTNFGHELMKTPGPTFLGKAIHKGDDTVHDDEMQHQSQPILLSNVDIALIPWAYRFYVLEHYRGSDYRIPNDSIALQAYHKWYEYVMKLPAVALTLPDKAQYLHHIRKYAENRANSQVAHAVRSGLPAHELDQIKNDYHAATSTKISSNKLEKKT
jgi:glutathione S-transferase